MRRLGIGSDVSMRHDTKEFVRRAGVQPFLMTAIRKFASASNDYNGRKAEDGS